MEILQPLAILHVALASGDVLDVAGIDQADLKTAILEDLEQGDPVDSGRLHRHGGDAAVFEPVGQSLEIFGEGPKMPHRLRIPIRRNRRVMDSRPEVDTCRIRIGFTWCGSGSLLPGSGGLWVSHDALGC